jgi:drug/metabolite transporter (DMT)-like permease
MTPATASRLQILAAALLFSTGGTVVKALSMTPWQIASMRSAIAAIALALVFPRWRRGWDLPTVMVGVAYAATMLLFVLGNRLTTAANTIFLQATAPLYLLFLAPLLLKERNGRQQIITGALVAVGMVLFFVGLEAPQATAPNPSLGNMLGAAAGVSWALTLTGLRWLGRRPRRADSEPGGAAVVVGNLIAALVALPFALPFVDLSLSDGVGIAYLGLFQIGLAYIFMTFGVKRIPAFEISLLLILEPVASVGWAWSIHGERPGNLALVGCCVILAATFLNGWLANRRNTTLA